MYYVDMNYQSQIVVVNMSEKVDTDCPPAPSGGSVEEALASPV